MKSNIQVFEYDNQVVEFEMVGGNLMINATEMSKIYGKEVENFTRMKQTEAFIEAYLKTANSRFIFSETDGQSVPRKQITRTDLIISRQKSGTWMNRPLALKFAAWLSPEFEVWVYNTIDDLLFGAYRRLEESLRLSAERKNRIEELKNQLVASDEYCELQRLELEEKQASYRRTKYNKMQLELFRTNPN